MSYQSPCPSHMIEHVMEKQFSVKEGKMEELWERLNCRETFVDGQIFPYQVEFDAPEQKGPFQTGELNIHHGPLLSVHGAIGEITETYRGLDYFYGSYVISFRWARPVKLEFLRDGNVLTLRLHTYVKPWFLPLWNFGNNVFWKFFGITFLL